MTDLVTSLKALVAVTRKLTHKVTAYTAPMRHMRTMTPILEQLYAVALAAERALADYDKLKEGSHD